MEGEGTRNHMHIAFKQQLLDCMLIGDSIDFSYGTVQELSDLLEIDRREIQQRKRKKIDGEIMKPFCGKQPRKTKSNCFNIQ